MAAALETELAAFFDAAPSAVAVYLFGSHARGDADESSDVDVAVLFDVPPASTLTGGRLSLEGDLERRLRRPVDLVVLNDASADLVHRVLRDGRIVVDRDRAARLRFEVRRRNDYFDLEPIRRAYRRQPTGPGRSAARR
jgi:hypothetical protein